MTTELLYPIKHMKIPLAVGEANMLNFTVIHIKVSKKKCHVQLSKRERLITRIDQENMLMHFLNKSKILH